MQTGFGLIPLLIYKALKQRNNLVIELWRLIPLLIYKALKPTSTNVCRD